MKITDTSQHGYCAYYLSQDGAYEKMWTVITYAI